MLKKIEFSLKSPVQLDILEVLDNIKEGLIAILYIILYIIISSLNFVTLGILGFIMDWKNVKRNKKRYYKYEGYEIIFFGKTVYEKRETV